MRFIKAAMLAACLLAAPVAAKAVTCSQQACTYSLVTILYVVSGNGFVTSQGVTFSNYDTLAHCQDAANNVWAANGASNFAGLCVPTASVNLIH